MEKENGYPLGQWTSAELAAARRQFESSLKPTGLPKDAPVRELMREKLGEVVDEQERRIKAAAESVERERTRAHGG